MLPEDTQKQLKALEEENLHLRKQLSRQENGSVLQSVKTLFRKIGFGVSNIAAGKGLKNSVLRLYEELPNNVSKNTMADVSSHIIWRITRIGIFAIAAAIIPILILMLQTIILSTQNEKLDYQNQLIQNQNVRLDQQVQLDESYRRSSFIFLMSNIMDKVDEELKRPANRSRELSNELIGRIAALSQALLPYRYLENDELTPQPLSPERGQLLFALVNSLLDRPTYDKIFEKSNFSYADLKQANFTGAYLRNINLAYAHFPDAVFTDTDLEFAILSDADLSDTHLENVNLSGAQLRRVKLNNAEIVNANFANANLQGVELRRARINGYFTNCRLDDVVLDEAEIEFALLDGAYFQSREWLEKLDESKLKGLYSIRENYQLEPEVVMLSNTQKDTLFRLKQRADSKMALMGNCERQILEIIRSAPTVQSLVERVQKQGEQIIYLTEANPFGAEDLDIAQDSVYLFRITTEDAGLLDVLMWVQFDPVSGDLKELPLTDAEVPESLSYSKNLWRSLPDYCR